MFMQHSHTLLHGRHISTKSTHLAAAARVRSCSARVRQSRGCHHFEQYFLTTLSRFCPVPRKTVWELSKSRKRGFAKGNPAFVLALIFVTVTHFVLMSSVPVWVLSFFEVARHIYGTLTHFLTQTSRTYVRVVTFWIFYRWKCLSAITLSSTFSNTIAEVSGWAQNCVSVVKI